MIQILLNLMLCIVAVSTQIPSTILDSVKCPNATYVKEIQMLKHARNGLMIRCGSKYSLSNESLVFGSRTYVLENHKSSCKLAVGIQYSSLLWGLEYLGLICQDSEALIPTRSTCLDNEVVCGIKILNEISSYYAPHIEPICCRAPSNIMNCLIQDEFIPYRHCDATMSNNTVTCQVTITKSKQTSSGINEQRSERNGETMNNESGSSKSNSDQHTKHSSIEGNIGLPLNLGSMGISTSNGKSSTVSEDIMSHASKATGISRESNYDWSKHRQMESIDTESQEYNCAVPPGYNIIVERLVGVTVGECERIEYPTSRYRIAQYDIAGNKIISDVARSILELNRTISSIVDLGFFIGDEEMNELFEENEVPVTSSENYHSFVRFLAKKRKINKDYIADIHLAIIKLFSSYPKKDSQSFELRRGIPLTEGGVYTKFAEIVAFKT